MDTMPAKTMQYEIITLVIIALAGYDTGCTTDKKHTYEFCDEYSLGYKTKWNSLVRGATIQ